MGEGPGSRRSVLGSRPRLLLINPPYNSRNMVPVHAPAIVGRHAVAGVTLPTVAALTPPDWDVTIVDAAADRVDFDARCDLVGITGLHAHLDGAARIGAEFRRRGRVVVAGGPSVTVSPERWRRFADVLVFGEAELTWPRFVREFEAGRHEAEYRPDGPVDLAVSPIPRYDLLPAGRYITGVVQTSRSCPFECEFCDVIAFLGRGIRYKPIDHVLAELEQVRRCGFRTCFLADDNITANRRKAHDLFAAMRDWNRRQRQPLLFLTQFSIDTARDPELLRLAAAAGITRAFVGVETPNEESLRETKKRQNLKRDLAADLETIASHGIGIIAGSIVGFDHDDLDIFRRCLDFYQECGVPILNSYMLQALDGTPLKARMVAEGRYISPEDYPAIREREGLKLPPGYGVAPTIHPKRMTLKELELGYNWLTAHAYGRAAFVARVRRMFAIFDRTPKDHLIRHPPWRLSRGELKIVYRLIRYWRRTRGAERRLWNEILAIGLRSRYPQRTAMIAWLLLTYTSNRMNLIQYNGIDPLDDEALARLPYPARAPAVVAAAEETR